MSKICNKILPEIKSQILSELLMPGSIVSKLAKSYNISSTTIHNWQRQSQKNKVEIGNEVESIDNFIELSIKDSKNFALEKASLIFSDFSIVIEGKVRSSSLFEIIKILEGESC